MRSVTPLVAGLLGVLAAAVVLRALLLGDHSAYMDESSFILTGRALIEERKVYARALDWTYGSYLWPLIVGYADIVGGLRLVRLITALVGALMVLATTLTAARLAPDTATGPHRWTSALVAGLLMAVLPTPIAIGRFGTYDALAGAALMGGIGLLASAPPLRRRRELFAAALLFFVAFLAKYVVAIFFPCVCLYLLLSPRSRVVLIRHLTWFVVPLSTACASYFLIFQDNLVALLAFSVGYTDLKSPDPLREYVWQRWDLWALVGLATVGVRWASRTGKVVAAGGLAVIISFHAVTRPDFDWWKHSIYAIFFLAPLAGLALAPLAGYLAQHGLAVCGWRQTTGTERAVALGTGVAGLAIGLWATARLGFAPHLPLLLLVVAPLAGLALAPLSARHLMTAARGQSAPLRVEWQAIAVALAMGMVMLSPVALGLAGANMLVTFYPNLNPSLPAIRAHTAEAHTVLVDDSAVRYYLYPRISTDRVTDPFNPDLDFYRRGITGRHFDVVVLDGGVGPLGRRIRSELGGLIAHHYDRVYAANAGQGMVVEIYRAREEVEPPSRAPASGATVYSFDTGFETWGAQPENAGLQPGLQVAMSHERPWQGRPSLRFDVSPQASFVGVQQTGPVTKVRAWLYVEGTERITREARVGMAGFDRQWQWRDDGFRQVVPVGRWIEITWELAEPDTYNVIGLNLQPQSAKTVYLGRVEIEP